jgi:hypothetical protein
MRSQREENSSGAICSEARGRVVVRQIVSAVGAVQISDADAFVANAAVRRDPIGALRTVIDTSVHLGTAARALGKHRLPQQKIQYWTDSALQDNAQQNPEPLAHIPAWRVFADVADHQHVNSNEGSPRGSEVDVHRKRAVVVGMQHKEEKILNANEGHKGQNDGPSRDEGEFFTDRE